MNKNVDIGCGTENIIFAIVRVGIQPSRLSLYPAVIKLEMTGEIPVQQLRTMRIELHAEQLLLVCMMRTWDSIGRYYHANLDPETHAMRRSLLSLPNLAQCTHVKFFMHKQVYELPNDPEIFREFGE